jgi:hypothetical protein
MVQESEGLVASAWIRECESLTSTYLEILADVYHMKNAGKYQNVSK